MQHIGFNFSKIQAERVQELTPAPTINTNIEFTELVKDTVELLKDAEVLRVGFRFSITYHSANSLNQKKDTQGKEKESKDPPHASLIFEGTLLFTTTPETAKELLKHWKKREILPQTKIPLFNIILRRCSTKALELEEQLSLPPHIPLPQLRPKQEQAS